MSPSMEYITVKTTNSCMSMAMGEEYFVHLPWIYSFMTIHGCSIKPTKVSQKSEVIPEKFIIKLLPNVLIVIRAGVCVDCPQLGQYEPLQIVPQFKQMVSLTIIRDYL